MGPGGELFKNIRNYYIESSRRCEVYMWISEYKQQSYLNYIILYWKQQSCLNYLTLLSILGNHPTEYFHHTFLRHDPHFVPFNDPEISYCKHLKRKFCCLIIHKWDNKKTVKFYDIMSVTNVSFYCFCLNMTRKCFKYDFRLLKYHKNIFQSPMRLNITKYQLSKNNQYDNHTGI